MVDGIDGSGKSTVIAAWKNHLVAEGNTVFDLNAYAKQHGHYPELAELRAYDFVLSGEPTYAGIGAVIRHELIKTGTSYSTKSIAEAYALDRLMLYTTLLIPLLDSGVGVIQDRGVSTSLCYQHISTNPQGIDFLTTLEGNALALQHRPDYLVLLNTPPSVAATRLTTRAEKQDNVIFERLAFLEESAAFFAADEYRDIFRSRGTQIHSLAGDTKIDILQEQAIVLLNQFFKRY